MILVIIATLLVLVVAALLYTDGIILFRTDKAVFDRGDDVKGALINLSRHAIEIRSSEPLIYQLFSDGWRSSLLHCSTCPSPPTYEPGWVQPGSLLRIDISFIERAVEQRWILLEQQYFYNGNEYVIYSNRLVLDNGSSKPLILRRPPSVNQVPSIRANVVEPYTVSLSNGSTQAIWFNPFCSGVGADDWPTDYDPFATLQRRTGEGTWQVLRPDRSQCIIISESTLIEPGETVRLSLEGKYLPPHALQSGVYRWHLVYYPEPFPQCDDLCKEMSRHLFTETFKW